MYGASPEDAVSRVELWRGVHAAVVADLLPEGTGRWRRPPCSGNGRGAGSNPTIHFRSAATAPSPSLPPLTRNTRCPNEAATTRFVDSIASFLRASSRQLRAVLLEIPTRRSSARLVECLLLCSQLRSLTVNTYDDLGADERDNKQVPGTQLSPGVEADVDRLDPTVASLPPLLHLKRLRSERCSTLRRR
jgi:hypothetical protein